MSNPPVPFPAQRLPGTAALARRALVPVLLAASAAASIAAPAADAYEVRPYGRPWSASDEPAPTLRIDGRSLVLSGGDAGAAALVLAGQQSAHRSLALGGELLVAGELARFAGRFDAEGRFVVDLDAVFARGADVRFVQGMARDLERGAGAYALSRGLRIVDGSDDATPAPAPTESAASFDLTQSYFPPLAVDEVLEAIGQPDLGEALVRMLNSSGDSIELELEGEVTVGAGACLGGKVELAIELECAEAGVYDLLLGRGASFLAGVELCEGVEAQASVGAAMDDLWRFHSREELERGLAAFAVMQAMGPGAEIAAEGAYHVAQVAETALTAASGLAEVRRVALAVAERARIASEQAWQHAPYWLRAARQGVMQAMQSWTSQLRVLTQAAEQARAFAETAAANARAALDAAFTALTWVHDSRVFLSDHVHGFEIRFAKGAELELSCGPIPGVDLGGVGAGLEVGLDRTVHLRWTGPFGTSAETIAVSFTSERAGEVNAGFGAGVAAETKRELEIQKAFRRVGGSFQGQPATVRVAVDLEIAAQAAVVLGVEAGAGRTIEVTFAADELAKLGEDGVAALLDGDASAVVRALADTRGTFAIDDRVFGGLVFELGVSYVGNGFSVEAGLRWSDHGDGVEEELSIADAFERVLGGALSEASQSVASTAAEGAAQAMADAQASL